MRGRAGLTERSQVLPLDLLPPFGITHKQPDCGVHGIFLNTRWVDRSFHLGLFKRFQVTVDAPLGASVALLSHFPEDMYAYVLPLLPEFEDVGSKRIKGTVPLASLFGFGKGSRRQPSVDRAITQAKLVGNLLWLPSLLVQLYYLLITRVAARTPRQTDFLYMSWFLRTPFY